MARGADEDRFRPRPGRARAGGTPPRRFTSQVLRAAQTAGGGIGRKAGKGARNGRGRVAAQLLAGRRGARSRRVVVKARLVVRARAAPGSAAAHLRYIRRDGVSPDGEPGQVYGPTPDRADGEAFLERGREDRHQFRFIVAPEDADDIGDLSGFTRRLMGQVEADLGTRLDWIAVDHHDTDNPHTHLMLRGVDDLGRDLVIARDYIAHGFRLRASSLATELLGPQTERELAERIRREAAAERWTGLDRRLAELAQDGVVTLDGAGDEPRRLRGRLKTLERLGLAEPAGGGWRLRADLETTLRAMGERGDILRTLQRAFAEPRPLDIDQTRAAGTVGRIVAKGLADELSGRGYLVLDGLDGRARYLALPPAADLGDFPQGATVEVRTAAAGPRAADRTVAALAQDGVYRPSHHLDQVRSEGGSDPEAMVRAHVRRLEALRRAGVAERLDADRWRLPADFLNRAAAHDAGGFGALRVEVLSVEPPGRLAGAIGATWLDRALIAGLRPAASGFGADVAAALDRRRDVLVGQGLAERDGARVRLARDLLATLTRRELGAVGAQLAAETGLEHRLPAGGDTVRGTYRRSLALVSGRFALIDDGLGFSLVPWRPVLERRLGQAVSGVVGRGGVDWSFGRTRGQTL